MFTFTFQSYQHISEKLLGQNECTSNVIPSDK